MKKSKQKVVLITGGSSDIGLACAGRFAEAGCALVLVARDEAKLEQASERLRRVRDVPVLTCAIDLSAAEAADRVVERALTRFDALDVLVNNAAVFGRAPALEMPVQLWHEMFAVNVHSAFYMARAFARVAIERGWPASIVNISSIAAVCCVPEYAGYGATKAALDYLTRALALEWAPYGIRVNGVAPAHTNTRGIREAVARGELDLQALLSATPLGRLAEPEEIAEFVYFVASQPAAYLTGQTILLDGGRSVDGTFTKEPKHRG